MSKSHHSSKTTSQRTPEGSRHSSPKRTQNQQRQSTFDNIEFVTSAIGISVGLGNLWRFPRLLKIYGGVIFLVPYFTTCMFVGLPYFVMELSLGQYNKKGPLQILQFCPLLKGFGIATFILLFWLLSYYMVILSWALYYVVESFTIEIPWETCGHKWNTNSCLPIICQFQDKDICVPKGFFANQTVTSIDEFFLIAGNPGDLLTIGRVNWEAVLCLTMLWCFVFINYWYGVHWRGRFTFIAAVLPGIILLGIMMRCVSLDGAGQGIAYLFSPNFEMLMKPTAWYAAVSQIIFSANIGTGVLISCGKVNDFNLDIWKFSLIVICCDIISGLAFSLAFYSVVGFLANLQEMKVHEVAVTGKPLLFLAVSTVVAKLPFSMGWSILSFSAILVFCLSSKIHIIYTIIDHVYFWEEKCWGNMKMCMAFKVCATLNAIGTLISTQGGYLMIDVLNLYGAAGWPAIWSTFFFGTSVAYFYDGQKLYNQLREMIRYPPPLLLLYCWKYISPSLIIIIYVAALTEFQQLRYEPGYFEWIDILGLVISLSSMIWIPIFMTIEIFKQKGSIKQKILASVQSQMEVTSIERTVSTSQDSYRTEADSYGKSVFFVSNPRGGWFWNAPSFPD